MCHLVAFRRLTTSFRPKALALGLVAFSLAISACSAGSATPTAPAPPAGSTGSELGMTFYYVPQVPDCPNKNGNPHIQDDNWGDYYMLRDPNNPQTNPAMEWLKDVGMWAFHATHVPGNKELGLFVLDECAGHTGKGIFVRVDGAADLVDLQGNSAESRFKAIPPSTIIVIH